MGRVAWAGVVLGLLLGGCTEITVDAGDWPDWSDHQLRVRGSGVVATRTVEVRDFDAVSAWGVGTFIVQRTGRERLTVTGDDNVLPYIEVEVVDGTLELGPQNDVALTLEADLVYRLEVKDLDRIAASGAVWFDVTVGDQPALSVELSGATGFVAEGRVDELDVGASGATRFDGMALESGRVGFAASGTSILDFRVDERLEGSASGLAVVRYRGDPVVVVSVSGLASVERR